MSKLVTSDLRPHQFKCKISSRQLGNFNIKCQIWPYEFRIVKCWILPSYMWKLAIENKKCHRATMKSWQTKCKIVLFKTFNLAGSSLQFCKRYDESVKSRQERKSDNNFLMQFRIFIKFFTINFVIFDFRQISNILMFSSNQFVPDWSCFESFWTILNHFESVWSIWNQFEPV